MCRHPELNYNCNEANFHNISYFDKCRLHEQYLIIVYGTPDSAKYCSAFRFHTCGREVKHCQELKCHVAPSNIIEWIKTYL